MYTLSPRALGIHIRQIPRAHVTTITYILVLRGQTAFFRFSLGPPKVKRKKAVWPRETIYNWPLFGETMFFISARICFSYWPTII